MLPAPLILVVDDDPDFCILVEEALRAEGFRVRCVNRGEEALDLLAAEKPRLLFVDLEMPGMSGRELLARVAALDLVPLSAVVVISANALTHATGARWCMTKPLDKNLLLSVVADLAGPGRPLRPSESTAPSPFWAVLKPG